MIIEEKSIFSLFFLKIFKKIDVYYRTLDVWVERKGAIMKLLIALMACFCLMTYSHTAQATDWYYVSPDDKGNQLFIDNDSVQKSDYDAVLWLKVNEPGGDELRYKVYISRYNRTMEILEVDAYMPNGTQYDNVDYDKDPEPIEGNTNGQAIYNLLWN